MTIDCSICASCCSDCYTCTNGKPRIPCPVCLAIHYCSDEHLERDKKDHQDLCRGFADWRKRLRDTDSNEIDEFGFPRDVLEELWFLQETQYILTSLYRNMPFDGEPYTDIFDDQFRPTIFATLAGKVAPTLEARMGYDQTCFEIVHFNWTSATQTQNALGLIVNLVEGRLQSSIFEPPSPRGKLFTSNQATAWAAEMMLKVKMLLLLRDIENVNLLGDKIPNDVLVNFKEEIATSLPFRNEGILRQIRRGESLGAWIEKLEHQTRYLYQAIDEENPDFWVRFDEAKPIEHHEHSVSRFGQLMMEANKEEELTGNEEAKTRAALQIAWAVVDDVPRTLDFVNSFAD